MKFGTLSLADMFSSYFVLNIRNRDYRTRDLTEILDFLFNKCEISVLKCIEGLFRMGHYSIFDNEELGLLQKFKRELSDRKGFGVSNNFLKTLFFRADLRKLQHLELSTKFVELVKKRNPERFRKYLLEPHFNKFISQANGSWESFEFYFKTLEIQTLPKYEESFFIKKLLSDETLNDISVLRRATKEFSFKLDSLPYFIRNFGKFNYEMLMFLVEETNHVVNEPIYGCSLLCEMIYNAHLNNISIANDILSMVEKGAIISIETQEERYSTDEILEYFYEEEEFYLPIMEILVDICGVRFKKLDHFIRRVANNCRNSKCFSPTGLISVIEFACKYLNVQSISTRIFQDAMNHYYDMYVEEKFNEKQAEEFKNYINGKFGGNTLINL